MVLMVTSVPWPGRKPVGPYSSRYSCAAGRVSQPRVTLVVVTAEAARPVTVGHDVVAKRRVSLLEPSICPSLPQ